MTTRDAPRKPGRLKDPQLDVTLLDAAMEVLQEKGYQRATMADVARRARASTASLYRRWASKQAFLGAMAKHLVESEFGEFDAGSLAADVYEVIRRQRAVFESPRGSGILSILGECTYDDKIRTIMYQTAYEVSRATITQVIDRAIARGEIENAVPPGALRMLTLASFGGELLRPVFQQYVDDVADAETRLQQDSETFLSWLLASVGKAGSAD